MGDVGKDMDAVLAGLPLGQVAAAGRSPEQEGQFALMRRCQTGDEAAFEELVGRFQPRVLSIIRGLLRQSNDVEDIAQQVFTKVYFALARFDFRSAVATWIYKIAVNECYDHLRKKRVRRAVLQADMSAEEAAMFDNRDVAGRAGEAGIHRRLELKQLADRALAMVSIEDRILLVLKEIEGYSIQEVAAILSLNENTVKVRLFRARQALQAQARRRKLV